MKGLVRLYARPRLNSPILIAAWPGIGDVAMIVASYLRGKLGFKDLGEIDAPVFFDPIGVTVKDNVVEAPQFPASVFYYWKNRRGNHDVVLFIGEDQPAAKGYELANTVLDVAFRLQVDRVYTFAAAMTRMHHTENPRVWGVVTSPGIASDLKEYGLAQASNLQIAGLNGLLMGVAKERNMEGICLLGEVPAYATRIQNPMAALAVIKVLLKMLNVEIDLSDLAQVAAEAKERIKQVAAQAMGEYIDFFTEPIWESGEEDDEEEEDGDE